MSKLSRVTITLLLIPTLMVIVFILIKNKEKSSSTQDQVPNAEIEVKKEVTSLKWNYIVTSEEEPIKSDISLTVFYSDGSKNELAVTSITGICNPDPIEAKLALDSEQLTCYFAGLGHKFRIIESENKYLVQQKIFEEASPDYNPPVQDFETILKIQKQF